jgi:CHAT domain-containing protein/tetratricopeptide (TPR) repeat protein
LLSIGLATTLLRAQAAILVAGSSFTREIAPKQEQDFGFQLTAGELISFTLETSDPNLLVRVISKTGDTLLELPHRRYGPLQWNFIAGETGRFLLRIVSLETNPTGRSYRLMVDQIRASTAADQRLAAAYSDFYRAETLRIKWDSQELKRALQNYQLAATAFMTQKQFAAAAVAWQSMAEVHFNQGNYKDAFQFFNEGLRTSRLANDPLLILEQLNNLAYVQITQGALEEASALLSQVQAKLNESNDISEPDRKRENAQIQNNLGEIEYGRGNLKQSFAFFAQAESVWQELGDRRALALIHKNKAFSFFDSGNANEAQPEFEQALKLWHDVGDLRGEAQTLTANGNLQTLTGDTYSALSSHRTARDIFRRIGDQQGEAVTSNGLGKVFEDLNRKQEAIDNYNVALRLNHELGNRDFEAVTNYYLGRAWRDLGNFELAKKYYDDSLRLSRAAGKVRMIAMAQMDMAGIFVKQQRFAEGLDSYENSLAVYKQSADLRRQALTHQGLGELYRLQGKANLGSDHYRQALELFEHAKDPRGQAQSLYWLAKIAQEQGQLTEALAYSQRSIDLIEAQRARVVGQNWRSSYFASVRKHFELHVDILMQLDRRLPGGDFRKRAFEASERARARSLLELLGETNAEIRRGVSPELLARELTLRQQLSAKAAYQIKAVDAHLSESKIAELELEIRTLNSEYDFVQAQIKAMSPGYANLMQPSAQSLNDVQAILKQDPGTVLLEYMLGDERSYVWKVTPTGLVSEELPDRRTLEALALTVYQGLTARQQQPDEDSSNYYRRYRADEQKFCPSAMELSKSILAPLLTEPGAKRLLVVADGGLQYIPFDALPSPANASGPCDLNAEPVNYVPLLTSLEVVHLPSFSSLTILRQLNATATRPGQEIAVWADPVFETDDPRIPSAFAKPVAHVETVSSTGTREQNQNIIPLIQSRQSPTRLLSTRDEGQSIMRFAPAGLSLLLTGFGATRESVLTGDLGNYRILHFATHSLVNNRYPALTGLWLSTINAEGQPQNGFLQLHDVYGLRLNADLVVLSGCQTGLGEELSGEGLIGLTQGFLYAGSKSVVVSLWSVKDKTTEALMASFYEAMLKDGMAPSAALRQAKLKIYQQRQWRSPYYWSAFVIQGEFRPAARTWREFFHSRWVWTITALLGVTAWMFFSWIKGRRRMRTAPGGMSNGAT